MKGGKITSTTALLLLLLTLGAEAELCKDRSRSFRGPCFYDMNCAAVCVTENYTGGFCRGFVFRTRCMCTKECGRAGLSDNSVLGPTGPPAELTARARRAGDPV